VKQGRGLGKTIQHIGSVLGLGAVMMGAHNLWTGFTGFEVNEAYWEEALSEETDPEYRFDLLVEAAQWSLYKDAENEYDTSDLFLFESSQSRFEADLYFHKRALSVMVDLEDSQAAITYLQQAADLAQKTDDPWSEYYYLEDLTYRYLSTDKIKDAEVAARRSTSVHQNDRKHRAS